MQGKIMQKNSHIDVRLSIKEYDIFSKQFDEATKEYPGEDIGIFIHKIDEKGRAVGYPMGTYPSHTGNKRDWEKSENKKDRPK